jgi:tetratricopeptide (TPR) repeat protein
VRAGGLLVALGGLVALGAGPAGPGAAGPAPLAAQQARAQDPMSRAFDLERRGDYAAAAEAYRAVLGARPNDLAALLGLERVLVPLNRLPSILPQLRAAHASMPEDPQVLALAVRAFDAAGEIDSARQAVETWAKLQPTSEAPFREWGNAALQRRDYAAARAAYRLGRGRLGRPDALAPELAELAAVQGDYDTAVREWIAAVRLSPAFAGVAAATLERAPQERRQAALQRVTQERDPAARFLEAGLLARFGDPLAGARALQAAIAADRAHAVEALRFFLDELQGVETPEAARARGMALEALADRLQGPEARRLRVEAARAYMAGGDRAGAQRVLASISDQGESPETRAGAAATLIAALIDDGKLDEAERRLEAARATLPGEDAAMLARRLALGRALAGDLARAERTVAADSSVDGLAARGRIALYGGAVRVAVERLRAAGPFAGSRDEATARAALLATLQPIEVESLPALGRAFVALDRGDTAAAVTALEQTARGLAPAKGGAELRLLAGRLAARIGREADAERLLQAAAEGAVPATAPSAELELGRRLLATGRRDEAARQFEHLILTFPQSALVPQARRALDESRGAVPPQ